MSMFTLAISRVAVMTLTLATAPAGRPIARRFGERWLNATGQSPVLT